VVTIAVRSDWAGRGLGARLLIDALDAAIEAELRSVLLEVRPSNSSALALYERFGFRQTGRRAGYYQDDGEDALVMETPPLEGHVLQDLQLLRESHRVRFPGLWSDLADS
jgi:ribosomal-protein-alanine N-acetyltransferase